MAKIQTDKFFFWTWSRCPVLDTLVLENRDANTSKNHETYGIFHMSLEQTCKEVCLTTNQRNHQVHDAIDAFL